jgi:pilus assembly protein CpaD
MITHRTALALLLTLAACSPAAEYTASEAPKAVGVETATTRVDLRFAAGSAVLASGDAARLRRFAAAGAIAPRDRVLVSVAGGPTLANQRIGAIAAELLRYGIVVEARPLPQVPPNQAIIEAVRSWVTLPPCPNWSKAPRSDFTNSPSSNFGCANAVNLGLMVATPLDLVSGRPVGTMAGQPAAAAVNRYLTDKVELPAENTSLPIASSSSSSTPNTGGQQ